MRSAVKRSLSGSTEYQESLFWRRSRSRSDGVARLVKRLRGRRRWDLLVSVPSQQKDAVAGDEQLLLSMTQSSQDRRGVQLMCDVVADADRRPQFGVRLLEDAGPCRTADKPLPTEYVSDPGSGLDCRLLISNNKRINRMIGADIDEAR